MPIQCVQSPYVLSPCLTSSRHTVSLRLRCLGIPQPDSPWPPSPEILIPCAECRKLLDPPYSSLALGTFLARRHDDAVLVLALGARGSVTRRAQEKQARLQDLHNLPVVLLLGQFRPSTFAPYQVIVALPRRWELDRGEEWCLQIPIHLSRTGVCMCRYQGDSDIIVLTNITIDRAVSPQWSLPPIQTPSTLSSALVARVLPIKAERYKGTHYG